jgi:hypothetical protein
VVLGKKKRKEEEDGIVELSEVVRCVTVFLLLLQK